MIGWRGFIILTCLCPALLGCNTPDNTPLVFLQTTTVGISVGTAASQGSPDLSLGYRDVDLAIVPVIAGGKKVRGEAPVGAADKPIDSSEGALMVSQPTNPQGKKVKYSDALSVFGQFQVDTGAGAAAGTPTVGLGKFFATGLAARHLAAGYQCKLSVPAKCQ